MRILIFMIAFLIPFSVHAADFMVTLPLDVSKAEMRDAICAEYNYQAVIDGKTNPETKNEFASRKLAEWFENIWITQSVDATKPYVNTAKESAEAEISGITVE